ncbi:hypothetical protein PENTCL1PPCAC_28139, partial [Pristionchus entomophagus]
RWRAVRRSARAIPPSRRLSSLLARWRISSRLCLDMLKLLAEHSRTRRTQCRRTTKPAGNSFIERRNCQRHREYSRNLVRGRNWLEETMYCSSIDTVP